MSVVISIEGLSKRYVIDHRRKDRHSSLRDALANGMKSLSHRWTDPSIVQHSEPTTEEFWALKDVSFDIRQGDRIGVIGRNGAGKSTLLKILSRITEPTSGKVKIRGRIASLLEVGTGFHPELTGRENIFLNGAILGMGKAEIKGKFDAIVDFAEVEKFLDTPVKRYSSGMYVRLAFSVAAHLEPEILIVDEVLAVGDAQFQKKCLGRMETVGKEGRTVIFVSHNIGAVRSLCSRAVLLNNGSLVMDDEVNKVVENYTSSFDSAITGKVVEAVDEVGLLQNASAVVTKIAVCDATHTPEFSIDTDTPFQIEVSYNISRDHAFVGLNIIVHDSEGRCVFGTINNHEYNWYGKAMPAGQYKSTCYIPNHFFNNGIYSIGLALFGENFSDQVSRGGLMIIQINDGMEVRGDYLGIYASATRPLFEWKTESCS
nr:ABC transporter ATP-binding protein [uncultured Rhodoferax sp.]